MASHLHSHAHDDSDDGFQILSNSIQWFEGKFSKLGAILNLLHLLILTRKSMRTSSVNSIMIGIAICDFLSMCDVIRMEYLKIEPMGTQCIPPPTLSQMNFDWFLTSLHNGLRRCSSWLAVLIALVRYLVICDIQNNANRFASPLFGLIISSFSFALSAFFSVFFFSQFHFDRIATWSPQSCCPGYSENWSVPIYGQLCNQLFEVQEGLFHRIQLVVEGIIGKLIPSILLPILTGLLLFKLKNTELHTGIIDVSVSLRHTRTARKDRVTALVIFIAITFLISEFPLGIVYIADAIWHHDFDVQKTIKTVELVCNAIFTANASIHCLICFSMSTSYRNTFIPCIAFPILTVSLLRALRKMKESGGNSGRKISASNEEKKELTTKLIVFMTIAFFITEAPLGMIIFVKAFFDKNDPISILSTDFVVYFSLLVTINSIFHPISCACMSSQYRDTIRKLLGVRRKTTMSSAKNKTSVVSVQGIQMT